MSPIRQQVRDNWIGFVLLVAVIVGLAATWHNAKQIDDSRRQNAVTQSQFNLRLCTKGVELRDKENETSRTVNTVRAKLYQITKAAADQSGDPPATRERYRALADELSALPEIKELSPTDRAAIVKLYSPTP